MEEKRGVSSIGGQEEEIRKIRKILKTLITLENNVLSTLSPVHQVVFSGPEVNNADFMYLITVVLNEMYGRKDNEAK